MVCSLDRPARGGPSDCPRPCTDLGRPVRARGGPLVGTCICKPPVMGRRDHDLGLVAANGAGEVTTQRQAVLEHAVGLLEEFRDLHARLSSAVVFVLGARRQRLR